MDDLDHTTAQQDKKIINSNMEADPLFHVKRQFYQGELLRATSITHPSSRTAIASYKGALTYCWSCSLGIWQPVTEAAAERYQNDHTGTLLTSLSLHR